ncbi:MAG: FAD-dependent oxidoreductase, partial [Planctomycetota bacterium]
GVELMLNTMVENVEPGRVTLNQSGDRSVIEAANVFWAAGVRAESIVDTLGCETDKMGRAVVRPDLSITGRSEVFVIGDAATVTDPKSGQQVPGVAQGAMQMGAHVGRIIKREINSSEPTVDRPPFTYWNKGEMATIGRGKAVADVGGVEFSGPLAWLLWAVVHIAFLVDFRSRLFALLEWAWMYVFLSRSVRLITGRGTRVQVKEPGGSPAVSTTAN